MTERPAYLFANQFRSFPGKVRESWAPRLVLFSTWSLSPRLQTEPVGSQIRKNDQVFRSYLCTNRTIATMSAAAASTAASRATANRQRTAVPREPPELRAYKTRFDAYLVAPASSGGLGLPPVDDLTPEDVASPGDIESIMVSWAEYMMTNPPRNVRNPEKLLKADGVGNGYGLVKEHLKDKFGQHDDWNDETWFTLSKGALVKKLERDSVRGTSGVDEVPGKIGIVRVNPDADIVEGDRRFEGFGGIQRKNNCPA